MGRIYDALKRAESAPRPSSKSTFRQNGNSDNVSQFVPRNEQEHPWERSAFTGKPSAFDSASTAHTKEATGGPALPGGTASRDAGATLGAVGSARAVKFSTREILAARVEPHLVAITNPRSPECEQFAVRTRLLQAGEREQNAHSSLPAQVWVKENFNRAKPHGLRRADGAGAAYRCGSETAVRCRA